MTQPTALIGWRLQSPQAALAFLPPVMLAETEAPGAGPLASRIIVARAAFDLCLRIRRGPGGQLGMARVPKGSDITDGAFRGLVTPIVASAQREGRVPAVQISLNIHLMTDAPNASLTLMPPVFWPGYRDWPGSLVSGRFPLTAWPRALNAVIEWQDEGRDWQIRRGDPLAYLMPEFDDAETLPELVEAALTPALARHLAQIDRVTDFARNAGPMLAEAARRRPSRLVVPRARVGYGWEGPARTPDA